MIVKLLKETGSTGVCSQIIWSPKVKMSLLLVDLKNTSRFSDRNDSEKEGIKYMKLQCKGHGEGLTPENIEAFITCVRGLMRAAPLNASVCWFP